MRRIRDSVLLAAALLAASCAASASSRVVVVEDRPGERRVVRLESATASRVEQARIRMVDGVWELVGRLADPDRFAPFELELPDPRRFDHVTLFASEAGR